MNKNGIKWGPFTLRIPFIHTKLLTAEFLQGLVISGATALAAAPVGIALGLSLDEAIAACFIASVLITSSPNYLRRANGFWMDHSSLTISHRFFYDKRSI